MRYGLKRLAATAAMLLIPASGAALAMATPALAANNGVEICNSTVNLGFYPNSPCADAYGNGGQLIKSYAPGNTWEYIEMQSIGSGQYQFYDVNTGACLGDNNNSSSDAKVGDGDSCPSGGTAGWGTRFNFVTLSGCPSWQGTEGGGFYNLHWSGYMQGGAANGSQWYLNNGSSGLFCMYPFT